jgi:hypothetical protein
MKQLTENTAEQKVVVFHLRIREESIEEYLISLL